MAGYRPQFKAGLELLARASARLAERGLPTPILVGGAAAELYTGGRWTTGDFDLVSPVQDEVEAVLKEFGFEPDRRRGRGLWHPGINMGIEVVGSALMDGRARREAVFVLSCGEAGDVRVIGIEDLIADRLGQFDGDKRDASRLDQALRLYAMADRLDEDYLGHRLAVEVPSYSVEWLKHQAEALGRSDGNAEDQHR